MTKIAPLNLKPYRGLITFFDLETAPNVGDFWKSDYNISVSSGQILLERQIISAQWRTVGDKKVQVRTWTMPTVRELSSMKKFINTIKSIPSYNKEPAFKLLASCAHTDKLIIEEINDVLRSSQLVVGQNSDKFDIPWLKGRSLFHRTKPLKNLVTLDTLTLSRKNFGLNSHSLDYKSKYLFNDGKIPTRYDMWQKVMQGDLKTLDELCYKYGKKDVILLEKIFCEMVPFCDSLPIRLSSLLSDNKVQCPTCSSINLIKNGYRSKAKRLHHRWMCKECGDDFTAGLVKQEK